MRVEDIHEMRLRRAETNHQTYKNIFHACCDRIRRRASLPSPPRSMVFQVPLIVWGRPPYKHPHATRYVSEKLRRNGFDVTEQPGGELHVSWTAAAAPTRNASTPKKKTKPTTKPKPKLSARLAALRSQFSAGGAA